MLWNVVVQIKWKITVHLFPSDLKNLDHLHNIDSAFTDFINVKDVWNCDVAELYSVPIKARPKFKSV